LVLDLEYQYVPFKIGRAGTGSYSDVQPIPTCLPGAELTEMTAVSFTLTLLVPLGGISPSTQAFALFSGNPKNLAEQYYLQRENSTNWTSSSREAFDKDVLALPDVYRVGMSGTSLWPCSSTSLPATIYNLIILSNAPQDTSMLTRLIGICRELSNETQKVRCTQSFSQTIDLRNPHE